MATKIFKIFNGSIYYFDNVIIGLLHPGDGPEEYGPFEHDGGQQERQQVQARQMLRVAGAVFPDVRPHEEGLRGLLQGVRQEKVQIQFAVRVARCFLY